jgi:hypothetical protein
VSRISYVSSLVDLKNCTIPKIDFQKIEKMKLIGKGKNGKIYKSKIDDIPVMIIENPLKFLNDEFYEKTKLSYELNNRNILKCLGIFNLTARHQSKRKEFISNLSIIRRRGEFPNNQGIHQQVRLQHGLFQIKICV